MRRLGVISSFGLLVAVGLCTGCRDYDSLTLTSSDLGFADFADLATPVLDGAAPDDDMAQCQPPPTTPNFDLGFPAISNELQTSLSSSMALPPKQLVVGHFVRPGELNVVTVTPGGTSNAQLHLFRDDGNAGLQYVTGGSMKFCVSSVASGHVDVNAGKLDRLVVSCDCGLLPLEECSIRTFDWSGGKAAPVEMDVLQLGQGRPVAIAVVPLDEADDLDDLVFGRTDGIGSVVSYAALPSGKFSMSSPIYGPALPFVNISALAVASFNNAVDKTKDIAALTVSGSTGSPMLAVLTRTTTGMMTLSPGVTTLPSINITGMSSGDLNQDGNTDLIFTTVSGDSATVFLQNGTSTMFDSVALALSGLSFSPLLVDWNRDGALDLFIWRQGDGMGNNLSTVRPVLFWNHGNMVFEATYAPTASNRTSAVVSAGFMLSPQNAAIARVGTCAKDIAFVDGATSRLNVFTR